MSSFTALKRKLTQTLFELAFVVTRDNQILDKLQVLAFAAEFVQVFAYIYDPKITWGIKHLQQPLSYTLMHIENLGEAVVTYVYWAMVAGAALVLITTVLSLSEMFKSGAVSTMSALHMMRFLASLFATILFFPTLNILLCPFVTRAGLSPYFSPDSTIGSTGMIVVSSVTLPLFIPVVSTVYGFLWDPDPQCISQLGRASPAGDVAHVLLKTAVVIAFLFGGDQVGSGFLFLYTLYGAYHNLFHPSFYHDLPNLWRAGVGFCHFVGACAALYMAHAQPLGDTNFQSHDRSDWTAAWATAVASILAGFVGAACLAWRFHHLDPIAFTESQKRAHAAQTGRVAPGDPNGSGDLNTSRGGGSLSSVEMPSRRVLSSSVQEMEEHTALSAAGSVRSDAQNQDDWDFGKHSLPPGVFDPRFLRRLVSDHDLDIVIRRVLRYNRPFQLTTPFRQWFTTEAWRSNDLTGTGTMREDRDDPEATSAVTSRNGKTINHTVGFGHMATGIIEAALAVFPRSSLLWVRYATVLTLAFDSADRTTARRAVGIAATLKPAIELRYACFFISKYLQKTAFMLETGQEMDVLQVMRFQHDLRRARHHQKMAQRTGARFWRSVKAHNDQGKESGNPAMSPAHDIERAMHVAAKGTDAAYAWTLSSYARDAERHDALAMTYYTRLLEHFPSSRTVLRLFASYVATVKQEPGAAKAILEYVDQLEDEESKRTTAKMAAARRSVAAMTRYQKQREHEARKHAQAKQKRTHSHSSSGKRKGAHDDDKHPHNSRRASSAVSTSHGHHSGHNTGSKAHSHGSHDVAHGHKSPVRRASQEGRATPVIKAVVIPSVSSEGGASSSDSGAQSNKVKARSSFTLPNAHAKHVNHHASFGGVFSDEDGNTADRTSGSSEPKEGTSKDSASADALLAVPLDAPRADDDGAGNKDHSAIVIHADSTTRIKSFPSSESKREVSMSKRDLNIRTPVPAAPNLSKRDLAVATVLNTNHRREIATPSALKSPDNTSKGAFDSDEEGDQASDAGAGSSVAESAMTPTASEAGDGKRKHARSRGGRGGGSISGGGSVGDISGAMSDLLSDGENSNGTLARVTDLLRFKTSQRNNLVVKKMTATFTRSMVSTLAVLSMCIVAIYITGVLLLSDHTRGAQLVASAGGLRRGTQEIVYRVRGLEQGALGAPSLTLAKSTAAEASLTTAAKNLLSSASTLYSGLNTLLASTDVQAAKYKQQIDLWQVQNVDMTLWDSYNARPAPTETISLWDAYLRYLGAALQLATYSNTTFATGNSSAVKQAAAAAVRNDRNWRLVMDNGASSLFRGTWNLVTTYQDIYAENTLQKQQILTAITAIIIILPIFLTAVLFWPAFIRIRKDRQHSTSLFDAIPSMTIAAVLRRLEDGTGRRGSSAPSDAAEMNEQRRFDQLRKGEVAETPGRSRRRSVGFAEASAHPLMPTGSPVVPQSVARPAQQYSHAPSKLLGNTGGVSYSVTIVGHDPAHPFAVQQRSDEPVAAAASAGLPLSVTVPAQPSSSAVGAAAAMDTTGNPFGVIGENGTLASDVTGVAPTSTESPHAVHAAAAAATYGSTSSAQLPSASNAQMASTSQVAPAVHIDVTASPMIQGQSLSPPWFHSGGASGDVTPAMSLIDEDGRQRTDTLASAAEGTDHDEVAAMAVGREDSDGEGDDTGNASISEEGTKETEQLRAVVVPYLLSVIILLVISLALAGILLATNNQFGSRGIEINYAGSRRSGTYRLMVLCNELIRNDTSTFPDRVALRSQITYEVAYNKQVHNGVLRGDESLGLPGYLGRDATMDALMLQPLCTLATVDCMAVDQQMSVYLDAVAQIATTPESGLSLAMPQFTLITAMQAGSFAKTLDTAKNTLVAAANPIINSAQQALDTLFGISFVLMLAAAVLLRRAVMEVQDGIARTRYVLLMVPQASIKGIAALDAYMREGKLLIDAEDHENHMKEKKGLAKKGSKAKLAVPFFK